MYVKHLVEGRAFVMGTGWPAPCICFQEAMQVSDVKLCRAHVEPTLKAEDPVLQEGMNPIVRYGCNQVPFAKCK
jgi:hypothetical protein